MAGQEDGQDESDDGLRWLALAVTIILLGLIIALVLFFKLNLYDGGSPPPLPST